MQRNYIYSNLALEVGCLNFSLNRKPVEERNIYQLLLIAIKR